MNALDSPPKEKPLLGGEGLRKLTAATAYHALHLLQAPFGFVFWLLEQHKLKLQDHIENERGGE